MARLRTLARQTSSSEGEIAKLLLCLPDQAYWESPAPISESGNDNCDASMSTYIFGASEYGFQPSTRTSLRSSRRSSAKSEASGEPGTAQGADNIDGARRGQRHDSSETIPEKVLNSLGTHSLDDCAYENSASHVVSAKTPSVTDTQETFRTPCTLSIDGRLGVGGYRSTGSTLLERRGFVMSSLAFSKKTPEVDVSGKGNATPTEVVKAAAQRLSVSRSRTSAPIPD